MEDTQKPEEIKHVEAIMPTDDYEFIERGLPIITAEEKAAKQLIQNKFDEAQNTFNSKYDK